MTEYVEKASTDKKQVVVDRELTKLYQKHKTVNEELVIAAAKNPASPLHEYFEWDDTVAAHSWRKTQALQLILASKMVVVLNKAKNQLPSVAHAEEPEVRRLVNAFRGEGFKLRTDALSDDTMRAALIEKHKAKLVGWCRETIDIEELQKLRSAILKQLGE